MKKLTVASLYLSILLTLLFPFRLFSQESNHPIDKYLDSCLEKNPSTSGMVNCIYEAFDKWDAELNKYYKLLMSKLDDESAKALKESELEWVAYKEKEFKFINKMYSKMEGTMYIPMRADDRLNIVKTRALELEAYCNVCDISTK